MKNLFQIFFLFLSILTATGCEKASEPLPLLRIGHAPHDHHSALFVAAMNPDYFKKHGNIYLKETTFQKDYILMSGDRALARVLIDSSTGGKELIRKLSEEYFDISFGGFPAILHFIDQGSPVKILAPMMMSGAGLVVHNDFPANNWPEFVDYIRTRERPVKIGYKTAISVQNLLFEEALQKEKISYGTELTAAQAKIIVTNLHGAKNLIPGLTSGLLDGFVVNQPYLSLAEEQKAGKVIAMMEDMLPHGKGHPCCALAGNTTYIQKHSEISEALLTLLMRATLFINEQPDKSTGQIAHWLEMPVSVEERSLPTIGFSTEFSESWTQGVEHWVESMINSGRLNKEVKEAYQQGYLEKHIYDLQLYRRAKESL
jgi:sulfonate transport system substrate-binding protein